MSEQLFFPIFVTFPLNCLYNIFPQEYYDQLRRIASKFSRGSLREKVSWLKLSVPFLQKSTSHTSNAFIKVSSMKTATQKYI